MEQNKALVISIIDRMKTVLGVRMDKDISDQFDGSRSLVSVWKTRGVIPFNECVQLAVDKNVSLDWLILGRGEKDITEPVLGVGVGKNLSEIPFWDAERNQGANDSGLSWFVPADWVEQEGLKLGDLAAVRVPGDAMAPTLQEGDIALVNLHGRLAGDGIAMLEVESRNVFRRIQVLSDGSLRLSCDNPAYAPETVPAADRGRVKVRGYCHALVKSLR